MALSWAWTALAVLSLFFGAAAGRMAEVGAAAMTGAAKAVELTLSLAGPLLLWSGLLGVLERSGVSRGLGRRLGPVLRRLFPSSGADPELSAALGANLGANLLGLGNAATPAGIRAAVRLRDRGGGRELRRLVVLNTASVQLFPAAVGALRQALGSAAPYDILPAVWLTSLASAAAGLLADRILPE